MSRTRAWAYAGLACWVSLAFGGYSLAQAPQRRTVEVQVQTPASARQAPVSQDARGLTAKNLLGSSISLQGGQKVGTVDDIIFADNGAVDYLVVRTEGKFVLVPWEAARFNRGQRSAVVDITPERFRDVPTFTQENWPNFSDPGYRNQLYNYYGLRPGQERRLERRENRRR